ncbi:MAG: hypothetical protein AB1758_33920, partial [Candidatus Eremiobacterota bacterium]
MSSEPNLEELVQRIEFLEAQNYGLKRVGTVALVLLLVIGAGLVYQTWAELGAVVTQGIVLSDSRSAPTTAWTVTERGHVGVINYVQGNLPDLKPSQTVEPFRGVGFYDSSGQLRIQIGFTADDQARLALYDPTGKRVWEAVPLQGAAPPPEPQPAATPEGTPPGAT